MTVTGVTVGTSNSDASIMNSDVSLVTYADFGQNLGWYKTDSDANALLTYLRQQQGGVTISYLGGQETYTLPHEMGNFTGATDNGAFMALGYNATASVQHNGVYAGSFTTQYVGNGNAIYYQGIEYRIDNSETFLHSPKGGYDGRGNGGFDHKVTRMSKIITDVEGATLFSGTSEEMRNYVAGELVYHVGAGTMQMYDAETGKQSGLLGAYHYIVGGIETATHTQSHNGGDITYISFSKEGHESITTADPLPFAGQNGDSGSPMFVYNEHTGQYEYIGAVAYIGGNQTQLWGAIDYVRSALTQYDKLVHTTDGASELRIGAVNTAGETITADNAAYNYGMNREVSTTPYSGKVTGNGIDVDFVGVRTGINTWENMFSLRNTNNWYSYNNDFLNAAPHIEGAHATADKELTYADLFVTENLVFAAGTAQTNIVLDATVDLGIGYAQFSLGGTAENPLTSARFDIAASGDYQFNHAGYVIDKGVDVYTTLTGHQTLADGSSYMFEWRKLGAGNLHIEGSGNNDIFLNVGGAGKTYLNRENGYAAYNVLANTHTTVVINDIGQIYRDFTFGHQGGVLDMNGNSMVWNNANGADADGFTIHALDDQAIVANLKSGSTTTLTWTQGGAQTFLGSFADNGKDSALKFVYNGGEGASLTLNSIKTHLTNANSGMEVQSGTLTLVGTNTVHGKGSLTGTNADRYHSDLDWHYADATSNVTVAGGTFELGSHARLTGNVTVQDGGTFLMREGVQHAQEYIEGSTVLMNTAAIDKFYGLKGNIFLEDGGTMRVEYNEGVTVNNTYAGNISGSGAVVIDLGATDAMFTLAGRNTFTGSKTLEEGILVATNVSALGNVGESRWLLGANGTLQVASGLTAGNALSLIDGNSTGTLALTEDMAGVLDMSQSHANLFVGAEMGKKVNYGTSADTLNATAENKWNLGGGGGELVVNAALTSGGTLVLGNGQGLGGIVTLTNTGNSIGSITFNPGVTLSFDSADALGGATIDLTYGSSLLGSADAEALLPLVTSTSTGSILLDRANNADFDLSAHQVALGSQGDVTYAGNVTVAENAAYRFGGGTGTLTLTQALAVNGTNNLEIDGQGHSGSKVILGAATGITGQVTVQGSAQGTGGDITLGFLVDNALNSASQTIIREGGIVDIGSTSQNFANLQVAAGGLLIGNADSTLTINMTQTGGNAIKQLGTMHLGQIIKTGTGELLLSATGSTWEQLTIQGGTVFTQVDNALSATGITRVESGGVLSMNTWNGDGFRGRTMHGNVLLAGGTLEAGTGSYDIIFNGTISAEAGTTGTITGGAKWVLNSSENNRNGGTLLFNSSRLELNQGYEQYIGGTFVVGADTLALHSDGATENMLKHFNSVNLASGKTLNITERTWNTIWQLDELTGAGTINWDSDTTHSKTARLILGGEGEFSGTINMLRHNGDGGRTHQAYIEINGENAVSGATLNFSGTGSNSQASLAINADNVNVGGLQSNVTMNNVSGANFAHVFAGAAPDDAASSTGHASTRKATLTLTGANTYTYTGNVGTTSDTLEKSLNVTMAGTGTQSFECGTFVVGDLTAKSGNLRVQQTANSIFSVLGDVNLYQGATLSLVDNAGGNGSYTLGTGSSINIYDVADLDASVSAHFNTDLVLAGGTINFDAAALATGGSSAMLDLSSVQAGAVNISFSNTGHLGVGEYYLISGDWSALANQTSQITLAGLPHMTGTFVADSSGLKLTLTKNADSRIWSGTASNKNWSQLWFGTSYEMAYITGTVVFDDSASFTEVSVTTAQNVENMVFNASEKDYILDATAQSVTAEHLYQQGERTATLLGDVNVTNATTIAKGELVVTKAVEKDANGAYISGQELGTISGEGTLTIDWGAENSAALNITHIGTLDLKSGTYELNAADTENGGTKLINKAIVGADATLKMANGVILNSDLEWAGTITAEQATLNGQIAVTGDANLAMSTSQVTIKGDVDGAGHTLTKTGEGDLRFDGAQVSFDKLTVSKGSVTVANTSLTGVKEIELASGHGTKDQVWQKLILDWGGGLNNGTKVLMNTNSALYVENKGLAVADVDVQLAGSAYMVGGRWSDGSAIYGTISTVNSNCNLTLVNHYENSWQLSSTLKDTENAKLTLRSCPADAVAQLGDTSQLNVIITGDNSFSGGLVHEYGLISTGHAHALGTGVVSLGGYDATSDGKLLLNKNLTIAGVQSLEDWQGNISQYGTLSLNRRTLTVGAYGYEQNAVYAGSFNNALIGSIAKIGSNTQEFSSATAKVENVSVQGGALVFSNAAAQIVGDIEVGTESGEGVLTMAGSYTLDSNRTLSILSTERSTLGGLTLNGGVMALLFDETATADTVALMVTGAVQNGSMTLLLNGLMPTESGEYLLVGGDFSNVGAGGISIAVNDASAQQLYAARSGEETPELYTSVKTTADGLYLVLSEEDLTNTNVWAPSVADQDDVWSTTSFSRYDASGLAEGAIFDASAIDKSVRVTENVSVSSMSISGGGYSFSGEGQILLSGSLDVSEGDASIIDKIDIPTGPITVSGTELTIVQLTPTNPAAPIQLTNAAKLTIGSADYRYGSFSGQVTGDAGSQLHLYTTQVSSNYWQQDGTIQLLAGSTVQDVYIHGDLALNIIAGSQGSIGDKFTNVQGANLHMDAGSQLVVRAEEGTGITPTTGNIVLGGDLSIVTYSPLTTATSITSNFTQEADATTNLKKVDTGSITLSGNIDVDAITVEKGTLQLTGSSIASGAYSVASGAALQFSGAADVSAATSALLGTTGAGNVSISGEGRDTTTLKVAAGSASSATGALSLSALTLDMCGNSKTDTYNLSSYTSMNWNDVTVKYHGQNTTFKNVTVGSLGASLIVQDMEGDDIAASHAVTFDGLTTLNGAFNITNVQDQWKYKVNIKELTGTGSLTMGSENNRPAYVTIDKANNYAGNIAVSGTSSRLILNNNAATSYGSTDATVTLSDGASLRMNGNGALTLNSKLVVSDGSTSILRNDSGAESLRRTLAAVEIGSGATLELQQESWNTFWTINDLSGAGNLTWQSTTTHWTASLLVLNGDGSDYTGTITLNKTNSDANRSHQAYIEIATNDAVKGATVSLSGVNNGVASLAINTENATMQGLTSNNVYAHLYAGASPNNVGSSNDNNVYINSAKASTAANTLTIDGAETYEFKGTIGTAAETEHLNLAMTGEGSQTFSGVAHVGNVSVSNGTLALSNAGSQVYGDITVSGGTLDVDATYTLGAEQTLSVLTGTANSVQLGGLILSGGEMVFDASMLSGDTAALSVGTLSLSEGTTTQNITFNNDADLETGRYLLSGSWTALDGLTFTAGGFSNGSANVVMQDGKLYLDYVSDKFIWTGSADGNWNYSSQNWDNTPGNDADADAAFSAGKIAIFETDANVTVSEAVSANKLIVRDGATLTLTETADLTADAIELEAGTKLVVTPYENGGKKNFTETVLGTGSVELWLNNNYGNAVRLEGFDGELYVNSGWFDLYTSTAEYVAGSVTADDDSDNVAQLGTKLHVGQGVNMQLTGGKTVVMDADMVLSAGNHQIHHNGSAKLIVNGDVTGEGTWEHKGTTGTLTFSETGSVTLGGFSTGNVGTISFNGVTTLGTANLTQGEVTFANTTDIGTATISGGTTVFKNNVTMEALNLNGGAATLWNTSAAAGADKLISTVKLGNGAVLTQFSGEMPTQYTHLSSVELTGAKATIKETNFGGAVSIGTLKTSNESGTSQLVLEYNHSADNFSIVKLGSATAEAGNFAGTITMDGTNNGNYRAAALIIENADIAKNAVIDIQLPDSSTAEYAVGINADNTTIAGLSSSITDASGNVVSRDNQYTLFSGSLNLGQRDQEPALAFNTAWIQNAAQRTLTFNVAQGGDYTFTGNVVKTATSGLNLVKTGAGSQTISGVAAVGSLTVKEGMLALTNEASTASGDITVSGGSLNFGGSYTLGAGQVLSVLTGTADAVQLGGLTLEGGMLTFDAAALMADTAALKVNGTVGAGTGATVTLDFSKMTGAMVTGTYMLAAGDWTGANLTYSGTDVVTLNATSNGLFLEFTNDSVYTWVGGAVDGEGAANNAWSAANWDLAPDADAGNNLSFATGKDAIFNTNADVIVSDAVSAGTVSIMNGAQVSLGMSGAESSFTAGEVIVIDGKLTLGEQTNWNAITDITVKDKGTLVVSWASGLTAESLLLQGGTIELRNGDGDHYHHLEAAITVDGSGQIKGSYTGTATVIRGSITGTGELSFSRLTDSGDAKPITIDATMTDGANGALSVNIGNADVVYSNAKRYTGGTTIGAGGSLTVNVGGGEGGLVGVVDVYGTLNLNEGDVTGWGSSNKTVSAINVYDGGDLHVAVAGTGKNQTGSGIAINLQGGNMTGISDSNFDLAYGGSTRGYSSITAMAAEDATAENPTVSTISGVQISLRQRVNKIDVQEHAVLNVSSVIAQKTNDYINGDPAASGNMVLTKTGLGELVLSGVNTYTAATTVAAGTLTLAHAGALDSNVTVNEGALFRLEATSAKTFAKTISGAGAVEKTGAGTLTLTAVHTYTGDTTVKGGTLELSGAAGLAAESDISLASGTTLLLNATNESAMTLGNAISGSGTIHKKGTHETVLTGNLDVAQINLKDGNNQSNNTGTLSLTGDTVKANVLYAAYGTVNVGDGTDSTFMQLGRMETGDSATSNSIATLNVQAGSTLTVTGANNGASYKNASIILGEWVQSTNLNILGTMLATEAKALVGDNTANITIAEGGVMAVKGIGVADSSAGKAEKAQEIHVTLEDGATLILGSEGITTNKTFSGMLGAGTVGLSAATTTIAENLTLTSAEGTDFDTTQYAFVTNTDNVATGIERGAEAGVITLTGSITAAEGVAAKVNVKGNGTLKVAGAGSVATNVEVDAGATFELNANTQDMSYGHVISGEGNVLKSGSHNLTFTQDNSFTGTTTIADGTLILDLGVRDDHGTMHTGTYTLDGVVAGSGTVQVNTGTTLQVNSAAHSIGTAVNLQEDAMLHFRVDGDYTMGSVISGAGNVIVETSHKVTFNTAHSYTGATSIAGGTLELAGQGSLADLSHMWNGDEIDWEGLNQSSIYVDGGGTLLLNTDGDVTVHHMIQGTGLAAGDLINYSSNIHKTGTSHAVLAGSVTMGQIKVAGVGNNNADAGTLSFTGTGATVGKLYVANGDIHVGNGTSETLVQVSQLEVGDCQNATDVAVHVHQGSAIEVTGSNNGSATEGGYTGDQIHKNASFLVSEWGANTTLTVEGMVQSQHAKLTMGDAKTTINIDGGTLAVQGISDVRDSKTGTGMDLSLTNDGKLILGQDGLTTAQNTNIQLGKGTVGMTADMSIAENVTLTSAEGTTFDTTKYDYATTEDWMPTVERGSEGGIMTVTGNISSAADVAAKMNVVGAGTLQLEGNAALSGGLEVEQGSMVQVGEVFSVQSADGTAAATVAGPVRITQATDSAATAITGTGAEQTRIDHSLITIEQGASLTVENMLVSDTSRISGTPAVQTYATREGGSNIDVSQVKVVNTTIELSQNNAEVVVGEGGSTTTSITLGQLQAVGTSDASGALTLSGASNVMTVSSNALSNLLVLEGSSFVVDFSYLLGALQLKDVDFIYLSFDSDSVSYENLAGSTISATMDGHTIQAYFAGTGATAGVPNVGMYFDVSAIPEPTTTTLSILALAGLMVRRRRK